MKRIRRITILLGLACLLLALGGARRCLAAPAELLLHDSTGPEQIERLQARLRGVARVRIFTRGASLLAGTPTVSSAGIQASDLTMRSGIGYRTVSRPRLIPWAEIESIQAPTEGHAIRNSALIGGLAGTLIGLGIAAHQPCFAGSVPGRTETCGQRQITPVWAGALGGALIGAIVGNRHEHWQQIYP